MKMRITKSEFSFRIGLLILGFWTIYLFFALQPIYESFVPEDYRIPVAAAGFVITLYVFNLDKRL